MILMMMIRVQQCLHINIIGDGDDCDGNGHDYDSGLTTPVDGHDHHN